jgi:hypothetical protein
MLIKCVNMERERDCLKSKKKERLWSPYKERAGDLEKTDVERHVIIWI